MLLAGAPVCAKHAWQVPGFGAPGDPMPEAETLGAGGGEEATPSKGSRGAARMHPEQDAHDLPGPAPHGAATGRLNQGMSRLPRSWIRRLGIRNVSILPISLYGFNAIPSTSQQDAGSKREEA